MKHVYDDPRTPWHSTMNHCNLTNMSYDQTIQMLHHACQTTPESMQKCAMYLNSLPQRISLPQRLRPRQSIFLLQHPRLQFQSSIAAIIKLTTAEETIVNSYMKLILVQNQ